MLLARNEAALYSSTRPALATLSDHIMPRAWKQSLHGWVSIEVIVVSDSPNAGIDY